MKVHAAIMVAPGDFIVTGSAGHTVNFTAGEEVFVPPVMVHECKKYGARELRRFKDVYAEVPVATKATMQGAIIAKQAGASDAVIEVTSEDEEKAVAQAQERLQREAVRYTPEENKIKTAILMLLDEADEEKLTSDGIPKVPALSAHLGFNITAGTRDTVIEKMKASGDLEAEPIDG